MDFNIVSWNINGLNNKCKRNKIERILKKNNWNVIALQETHISKKHERVLINKRLGKEFISCNKKKKKGVVIYVKQNIKSEKLFQDEEGRMVGVRLVIPGRKIVVMTE